MKIKMKHPRYSGEATVSEEHVQTWEAKGWKQLKTKPSKKEEKS